MGAVYSAVRLPLGDTVAIKVILPTQDSAESRARFLREAQAAARIRHPNVVQVFDFVDAGATPYIVMEYLSGATLDDELRARRRLAVPRALGLLRQVCAAVQAGHRRGVLHRDLKPANVMLARMDDGREVVKVLDFGLARITSAPDLAGLTAPGALFGTYPYMSPEQVLGEEVTPLSEVYTLGVFLYEMVTGVLPYSAPSAFALMNRITAGRYAPPSEIVPDLPNPIVAAIAAALSQDPAARPRTPELLAEMAGAAPAADTHAAAGAPDWPETAAESPLDTVYQACAGLEPPAVSPNPLSTVPMGGETPRRSDLPDLACFVGRARELETLEEEYEAALRGEGRFAIILGDAGAGKSSLAKAFCERARSEGALVLTGRFFDYEGSRPAPFETFLDMLRAGGRAAGSPPSMFTTERLTGVPAGDALAESGEKWRAMAAVGAEFSRLAAGRPLVLVFEDLQWAGRLHLDLLAHLRHALAGHPALVVGTARDPDARSTGGTGFGSWLVAQGDLRAYAIVHATPFTGDDVRAWLQAAFGRVRVRSLDVQRLEHATGGNPYYLLEVVRHLLAAGEIRREGGEWECAPLDRVALPETVNNAVRAKLRGMPAATREALETAAVIGDEFRFETLRAASGLDEAELEGLLDQALDMHVLAESATSSPDEYRFYNAAVRTVLYEDLPPRRRRRLHGRAVEALRQIHGHQLDRVAGPLCYHSHAMGAWSEALRWGLVAGEEGLARHDTGGAERNLARAREAADRLADDGAPAPAEDLARLDLLSGTVQSRLGHSERARALLLAAAGTAERAGDEALRAQVLTELARHYLGRGAHDEALTVAERGAAAAESAGDAPGRLRARVVAAQVLVRLGRYDEAAKRFGALLSETEAGDPTGLRSHALLSLALICVKRGAFARGETLAREALEIAVASNDLVARQQALSVLGAARGEGGDYAGSLPFLSESLRLSRTLALRRREGIELANMGEMLWALGRLAEAEAHFDEALAIFVEIEDRACEGDCRVNLGRVLLAGGRVPEAVAMLEGGREICEATGRLEYAAIALLHVGEARLVEGDRTAAAAAFEAARDALESLGSHARWRADIGLARVAFAVDARDRARDHVRAALAHVEAQRANLTPGAAAESFSREVAEVYRLRDELDGF
jgi:tetratricopeptide (TPR) repeat protein